MKTEMNFIRCTCDICKKNVDVKKDEKSPMREISLPMNYYSETGSYMSTCVAKVDVCEDCLIQMKKDLCLFYDMANIAYEGVRISRKVVE